MPARSFPTPDSTRDLALNVAETLLHDHGYRGVSMEGVARGAGIKKASLYYHFPGGKDELMLAVTERLLAHYEAGFQAAIASTDTVMGQLHALAAWIFSSDQVTQHTLRESMQYMPHEHQAQVSQGFYRGLYGRVQALLEAGVARGELRAHDTALSAWAFMGLLSELGDAEHPARRPDLAERLVDLLVRGLHA